MYLVGRWGVGSGWEVAPLSVGWIRRVEWSLVTWLDALGQWAKYASQTTTDAKLRGVTVTLPFFFLRPYGILGKLAFFYPLPGLEKVAPALPLLRTEVAAPTHATGSVLDRPRTTTTK